MHHRPHIRRPFAFDPPERIARWRPLVHWLLVIPHLVILYVLQLVGQVLALVSWFVILFTGKPPEGIANFQDDAAALLNAHHGLLRLPAQEYPPFTFATTAPDPGDDPRARRLRPCAGEPQPAHDRAPPHPRHSPRDRPHLPLDRGLRGRLHRACAASTANWPDGLRGFVLLVCSGGRCGSRPICTR